MATNRDPTDGTRHVESAESAGLRAISAVVIGRSAEGEVDVASEGDGLADGGAVLGGGVGLVVGLFAPPLLASSAIGAGIGALLGHLTKKHEQKELGVEVEDYLLPDSSAIVVALDDVYPDRLEAALVRLTSAAARPSTPDRARRPRHRPSGRAGQPRG